MSEREQFEAMLNRAGVPFTVAAEPRADAEPDGVRLRIKKPGGFDSEPDVAAVGGYYGFYCDWAFDAEGQLVEVSIWE